MEPKRPSLNSNILKLTANRMGEIGVFSLCITTTTCVFVINSFILDRDGVSLDSLLVIRLLIAFRSILIPLEWITSQFSFSLSFCFADYGFSINRKAFTHYMCIHIKYCYIILFSPHNIRSVGSIINYMRMRQRFQVFYYVKTFVLHPNHTSFSYLVQWQVLFFCPRTAMQANHRRWFHIEKNFSLSSRRAKV